MSAFLNGLMMLLAFIVLLGVIVFVHELGHFLVAKAFNIKVLQFSLGFPPKMFGVKVGETEYCLSWIPLGGYCSMVGEGDNEVAPEDLPRSFSAQKPWKRACVLLAGPGANLILPIILYAVAFAGTHAVGSAEIGYVSENSPAAIAGIMPGDKIISIQGEEVKIFEDIQKVTSKYEGPLKVTVDRHGEQVTMEITPTEITETDIFGEQHTRKLLGVSLGYQNAVISVGDQDSPAWKAGLRTNDTVLAVNDQEITNWYQLRDLIRKADSRQFTFKVRRPAETADASSELVLVLDAVTDIPPEYPVNAWSSAEPPSGYLGVGLANVTIARLDEDETSPAKAIGLQVGDRLLAIDGKNVGYWEIDLPSIDVKTEHTLVVSYLRGREVKSGEYNLKRVEPDYLENPKKMQEHSQFGAYNYYGNTGANLIDVTYGAGESVFTALQKVGSDIAITLKALGHLLTGKLPMDTMGGPIMLFFVAGEAAEHGFDFFICIMAYLSINIGLLNLLPVPMLDGGHFAGIVIETVIRRPLPDNFKYYARLVGAGLLILLMFVAFKNDAIRYFIR